MGPVLGEAHWKVLQDASPVLSVYWIQESQKHLVEKGFGGLGSLFCVWFFVDLPLHELSSYREEERGVGKHV